MLHAPRFAHRLLRKMTLLAVAAILPLVLVPQASPATVVNGAGATFPYPLYSKWFAEYAKVDTSSSFVYQPVGSGEGVRQLLAGSVDFCGTDFLPTSQQLEGAADNIVRIPTVIGAVAVVYRIPGMGKGLKLPPDLLADIFRGEVAAWDDPRIRKANPKLWLPSRKINVVHRSDGSGTTDIFTDYLSKASQPWRREVGRGMTVDWPAGVGRKGNGEVTVEVKKTEYSIGYVELIYALESNLTYAFIRNRSGRYVEPDLGTIRKAAFASAVATSGQPVSLVNQPGEDSYPIVGLTWLLVYQHQKDHHKGRSLVSFLDWALSKGQALAPFLLYAPLPENLASQARKAVRSIRY